MTSGTSKPVRLESPGRPEPDLESLNAELERYSAEQRVRFACEHFPGKPVLTSSFGIQSAVMLHLVTRVVPGIPVILIDTGYLFPETYRFVDQLVERLDLNLKVYQPLLSPAWQEARHGRLWEQGVDGVERYNRLRKVEPMQRALRELGAGIWFAGLRRSQSKSRSRRPVVEVWQPGCRKVYPIVDWSNRDVHRYLKQHRLPYHPLWDQGYVSVGDVHTTRPLTPGVREEETRFFGLKRECGLHE